MVKLGNAVCTISFIEQILFIAFKAQVMLIVSVSSLTAIKGSCLGGL